MSDRVRTALAAAYLILCLLLGGAGAAGHLANGALQILAAALLAVLLVTERGRDVGRVEKQLWLFAGLLLALMLLQLVPLPAPAWTALPGRAEAARGFALLGVPLPWLPLSLSPDGTLRALTALLPALAIVALAAPLGEPRRRLFVPVLIAFAMAALLLGLVQVAGPQRSPFYFYEVTNRGYAVGFFANRNHQATLLLMALPFVAALATPLLEAGRIREGGASKIAIVAALFATIAAAILVNGSRAGVAILPVVAGACLLMVRKDLWGQVPKSWAAASAALLVAGLAAVGATGVVTRDSLGAGNVAASTREAIWEETARLALEFLPAGSGLGSFVPLYRMTEDPYDRPDEYINHAHNDYLEWLLETGAPGLLLLAAFLAWLVLRAARAWREPGAALGRAASIALGAAMIHSIVDYPLRTTAILALSALCLALLVPAPDEDSRPSR